MHACLRMLVAALLVLVSPVRAEDAREAGIRATITGQVEAFRHDDAARAFALASPMIQGMFRSPAIFMDMVRQGYPQVYRPREFRFGKLETSGGRLLQHVLVTGPDGALVTAVYEMIEFNGDWRINGCVLLRAGDEA